MEENHKHTCELPTPEDTWVIHGIWPTKFNTMGPFFCNKTWDFDIKQLTPIEKELEQFWINIEKGTPLDSLWQHEWTKHGTCAAVIEDLNNENKYFGQGLTWLDKFSMTNVLAQAGINPDSNTTVTKIHKAVTDVLGFNPAIHCIYDKPTQTTFLYEIRICFTKTMELTDCKDIVGGEFVIDYPGGNLITNCDLTKPVNYPSIVPPTRHSIKAKENAWKFPFVNMYKLIQLIKWFTL